MSTWIETGSTLDSMEIQKVKTIFIGESGVGKTSIINRFINNKFDNNVEITLGAQFSSKTLEFPKLNISLQFDIWDTAGQEKYRSVTKFFYRDSKIVILVYDITRESSFNEIKNFWLNQIKIFAENNVIICICGTKSDLMADEKVKEEDVRKFADENNVFFRLTSSMNNYGIDEMFEFLGKIYLKKNNLLNCRKSFSLDSNKKGKGKGKGKGKCCG
jgi:small GTP-binding protein